MLTVVDLDGLHVPEERTGVVALAGGMHRVTVERFDETGGAALSLAREPVGGRFEPVAASSLFHH